MNNNEPQVLAVIPARSGSKSVKDKNIRQVAGMPLLAHSIGHALAARRVNRTMVSTDSQAYAAIAKEYGAEAPFLRPSGISGDHSLDVEVFIHVLDWLAEHEGFQPDILVHLRPTYPVRRPREIDEAIGLLLDNPQADSVRSVAPAPETPFKMWFLGDSQMLTPVVKSGIPEPYNMPRQDLPRVYLQNACIDVVRATVVKEQNSMTGKTILGYVMNHNYDIDSEEQLRAAEKRIRDGGSKD